MPNETEGRIPLADLLVFHRLARSLTSSFDLDTILRTILEHMERMVDAEFWTLLMLDEPTQELYYAIAAGEEQEALRGLRVKVGEGVAGWVLEHGETLIVPEAEGDPRVAQSATAGHQQRAIGDCAAVARAHGHAGRHRNPQSARGDVGLHHRVPAHPGRPRRHRYRKRPRRCAHPAAHHHRRHHRPLQRAASLRCSRPRAAAIGQAQAAR